MSVVRSNTYQDASSGGNAILYGVASPPNSMGFRNRIINGDCRVDQRNAGASVSVSTSGVYVLDRWKNRANGGGVFSVQQSSTAPAGFTNSTVYTVTTADASIAAGDNYWIIQEIEGYNVADLGFGTANAQTITLSFWVRSSVTGTYSVFLSNGTTYDRGYVATFTISSANTFEYKTITIAGDTSGTWGKTNGGGLTVGFNLGAGTTYQTTAGAWAAGFFQGTSATTQWIATNGATFYITGVQLEAGTVASPFERRDYGRELMMCQRYFEASGGTQTLAIAASTRLPAYFAVAKRAAPTLVYNFVAGTNTVSLDVPTTSGFRMNNSAGGSVSGPCDFTWTASAEL